MAKKKEAEAKAPEAAPADFLDELAALRPVIDEARNSGVHSDQVKSHLSNISGELSALADARKARAGLDYADV